MRRVGRLQMQLYRGLVRFQPLPDCPGAVHTAVVHHQQNLPVRFLRDPLQQLPEDLRRDRPFPPWALELALRTAGRQPVEAEAPAGRPTGVCPQRPPVRPDTLCAARPDSSAQANRAPRSWARRRSLGNSASCHRCTAAGSYWVAHRWGRCGGSWSRRRLRCTGETLRTLPNFSPKAWRTRCAVHQANSNLH